MNYALSSALLLSSCDHKELAYEHTTEGEVNVVFDWSESPEASPKGMRVFFYGANSSYRDFWDLKADGGKVDLRANEYHALAINNDTEWIHFLNSGDFAIHSATTRQGGLYEPITGSTSTAVCPESGETVMMPPDPVWGSGVESQEVKDGSTIVLTPHPLYCTYTFEFRNIRHLDRIISMSASLSGMSQSVSISSGELSREVCTVPFEAHKGSDGESITGSFYTFGHHPEVDAPHHIALYLELSDGTYVQYTQGDYLDVTDQVHSAPDPRNVHLVIETPGIPTDDLFQSTGGGFSPTTDDWEDVETEIRV